MNKKIEALKLTTFAGRRFQRKQLDKIVKTVTNFPKLSRRELGQTICENLNWVTPGGNNRIQTCLNALEEMQDVGLFTLPEKIKTAKALQKEIIWTDKTAVPAAIEGELAQFAAITLERVTDKTDIVLWNEFIDRHHYLGYRKPIGNHLRYFIVALTQSGEKLRLGCLIFSFPVRDLACRDKWIGWNENARHQRLNLVLNNNRFLVFPWVKIKNLASKTLSLAARQLADDWFDLHGFRPVLLETFVDTSQYTGACYKAANWQLIGKTKGIKGTAKVKAVLPKDVLVYPLIPDCKKTLVEGVKKVKRAKNKGKPTVAPTKATYTPSALAVDDPFILMWQKIISIVAKTAKQFDQQWQQRKRIINTQLLILFIFRLVFSKNKQGYGPTIVELWEQCRIMDIPLPQAKPVAASAFSNARQKLDEGVFKTINTQIIAAYEEDTQEQLWKDHRVFAVDGSKLNLPRQVLNKPYKRPSDHAHDPQGLLSCLYHLKSKLPYDFELSEDWNERKLALGHLKTLSKRDVVVYDRGYLSYPMLNAHHQRGVDAVFRVSQRTFTVTEQFELGEETDAIVTIEAPRGKYSSMRKDHPGISFIPIKLRLVKYTFDDTTYILGTTLLDSDAYSIDELSDLYHARWGVEELYKISKVLIDVGDFHGQSDRGIKQELYAHFVLITLNRILASHTEDDLNKNINSPQDAEQAAEFKVNVKNALLCMARNLENLLLQHTKQLTKTINILVDTIGFCRQKVRAGRKYKRESKKSLKKWRAEKPTAPVELY